MERDHNHPYILSMTVLSDIVLLYVSCGACMHIAANIHPLFSLNRGAGLQRVRLPVIPLNIC